MGITLREADRIVLAFISAVEVGVVGDGRVLVQGFGSFVVKDCPPREIVHPGTGRLIIVPHRRKVRFRPCKSLNLVVNNGADGS